MAAPRKVQTYDVFVGNLPTGANEKNVGKIFSKFGEIQIVLVRESATSPTMKYAYVKYLCEADAETACSQVNGIEVEGQKVLVRKAEPKKRGEKSDGEKRRSGGMGDGEKRKSGGMKGKPKGFTNQQTPPDIVPEGAQMSNHSPLRPPREKESVMVSYVESPITMWVQVVNDENTNKLLSITEQLATLCPAAPKVNGQPQQNKVYAAQFSEDGNWYRCSIKHFLGTDTIKVQYIDYGNTEEISINNLVEIPPALSSNKPLANKMVFHNLRAKDLNDQTGTEFLRKLTENKVLEANKTNVLTDGTGHYGIIFMDGQNLNSLMIQEGYASVRPQMTGRQIGGPGGDAKESPSGGGSGGSSFSPSNSMVNIGTFGGGYSAEGPQPNQGGAGFNIGRQVTRNPNLHITVNRPSQGGDQFSEANQNLKNDLAKKKKELDKLKAEVAKKDLQLQQAISTKIKIHTVVELAEKVRKLRLQFPSDRASGLEEAIDLALSREKVHNSSVTTLQPVVSTLSTYRAAQKEICNSSDTAELNNLVETRDTARKQLYNRLEDCISELVTIPLDSRCMTLKEAEEKLRKNYKGFLHYNVHGCPQLEDLVPGFKDWKGKKECEFGQVRENTNLFQAGVKDSLNILNQLLTLDGSVMEGIPNVDLETLLRNYAGALQQEIGITDMENSRDTSLVATVLTAILKELQSEISTLDNFRQLVRDFTNLKSGIEPWLDKSPNLEEILETKKLIRTLKSKLRHKDADRQDLEESGDSNDEEFMKVQLEVEDLKFQLHKSLQTLDHLVVSLAKVSDEHFPELLIQHPDLGIQVSLVYNGLVKSMLDIDYFTLMPSLRVGMSSALFAGEPVYIQEYHIGDTDHLTKDEFLKQVIPYAGISKTSDHILTVHSVFFTKNERQAYLQLDRPDDLEMLDEYITAEKMNAKKRQRIIYSVTSAIAKMHKEGFVHGEVCPQNIAVQSDGTSFLFHPNFTKSLLERTKKKSVTNSGLCFQAPEVTGAPDKVGCGVDLYNLGLLILWIHHPDISVQLKQDGTPKLSDLPIDAEIGAILYNLLCCKPEARLAASHILGSGYLTRHIPDPPLPVISEETSEDLSNSESGLNIPLPEKVDGEDVSDDDSLQVTGTPCPNVTGDDGDIEGHIEELEPESTLENDSAEQSETLDELSDSGRVPDLVSYDEDAVSQVARDLAELPITDNMMQNADGSVENQEFKGHGEANGNVGEVMPDEMLELEVNKSKSESIDVLPPRQPSPQQFSNLDILKSLTGQQSYLREGSDSPLTRLLKASAGATESPGTPEK